MKACLCSYFGQCKHFQDPWVSFVMSDGFVVRVTKITSSIGVLWTHALPFAELSFNYILKQCLISEDLQIIRKKSRHCLDHIYSSCIIENFKVILYCIQDLKFAKFTRYTTLQPFEKTRQLHKPSCFKFSSGIWCDMFSDIFQFVRNENTKNDHAGMKRKFEEKLREKGRAVIIFT